MQHASHLMQPCDLRLFGSLKETWKIALRDWQIQHVGQYVSKYEFASIFKHAWTNATNVENAVKGFKDAGLFPLDKNAFLKTDKLQTSELFNSGPASVVEQTKNVETDKSQSDPEIGVTTQKESTVNVPNTATENTTLTNNEKESTEVLATCQTENSSEKITFFRIAIADYQRQVGLYFIETLQTLHFNHI